MLLELRGHVGDIGIATKGDPKDWQVKIEAVLTAAWTSQGGATMMMYRQSPIFERIGGTQAKPLDILGQVEFEHRLQALAELNQVE